VENIRELQSAGITAAAVPAELGGLDVRSPHDLAAGSFEVAQACSSTAIASWMHHGIIFNFAGVWRAFAARGRREDVARIERILVRVAEGEELFCVAGTEPGVYAGFGSKTEARPVDGGWVVNGLKTFATMSPAATTLNVSLKVVVEGEPDRMGMAMIPRGVAGLDVPDDWDGMGMRGSGSGVVKLSGVRLPQDAVSAGPVFGAETNEAYFNGLVANAGLVNAALGIAQATRDRAIENVRTRVKAPVDHAASERVAVQIAVAAMDIELMAAKAMQRAHLLDVDRFFSEYTPRTAPLEELRAASAASRATKTYVEDASMGVVNKAMSLAGGGSYVSGSDFARWYRDVRALPFMAPQATESLQFIGKVALGLVPAIDL